MQRGGAYALPRSERSRITNVRVSKFGKGLSREPLKHIFAAAPCWRGAIELSFNPNAWNLPASQGVASIRAPYLQRLFGADMR